MRRIIHAAGGGLIALSFLVGAPAFAAAEICNDGIDNDEDGLVDDADSDCRGMSNNQLSVYVSDAMLTMGDLEDAIAANKGEIERLEREGVAQCGTNNVACASTLGKLSEAHTALDTLVREELNPTVASHARILYGTGTATRPASGSLLDWKAKAEQRMTELEREQKRHREILEVDYDSDGIADGGLVGQMTRANERLDGYWYDHDGDAGTDPVWISGLSDRMDTAESAIANGNDVLFLGVGGELSLRKSWQDSNPDYSVNGAGGGGGGTFWYINGQSTGPDLGVWANVNLTGGAGSGMSTTAVFTLGGLSNKRLGVAGGVGGRFAVNGSFDGSPFAYRQGGAVLAGIGYINLTDTVRVNAAWLPTLAYEEGMFTDGVGLSSTFAGQLVFRLP